MGNKRKAGILLSDKDLKRRYPESGLASEICFDEEEVLRLPCRNLAVNYHIGGGIKYGTIIEIAGEESAGKTLLALDFMAVCQSLGGIGLWDDAEAVFDGPWAKKHGVKLDKLVLLPYENRFEVVSDWVADQCVYWRSKLTNNEPILLVIDSIAVMETGEAMETAEIDTKAEMGRRSFNMGKFLRKRMKIFAKYGICVIFINQIREKVGASMFEEKQTTPLQQAIKFYASNRLWLFRGKRIKKDNKPKGAWVGNLVYLRTKKNKTSIPRDNIQAEVYFRRDGDNFGYHKYFGFDTLLLAKKLVIKKRGGFYFKQELLAKGELGFRNRISTDATLRARFIEKLKINTASRTRKQMEELDENLYPVRLKVKKDEDEDENEGAE